MKIEHIKEMINKHKSKSKVLIVSTDTYFELCNEIETLGISFITSERLPLDTKAIVVDGDVFDGMYYLERGKNDKDTIK